jgi:hypothetical protein
MTRGKPTAADRQEVKDFPITYALELIETFEQGRVLKNGECLCLKALAKRFKEFAAPIDWRLEGHNRYLLENGIIPPTGMVIPRTEADAALAGGNCVEAFRIGYFRAAHAAGEKDEDGEEEE